MPYRGFRDRAEPIAPAPDGDARVRVGDRVYRARDVIDALAPLLLPERVARMDAVLNRRIGSVALGLENLHHTHNGAACLRTAEGVGLQDVIAAEAVEPLPLPPVPGARKVSLSAERWLDVHRVATTSELFAWAHARGMAVFGAAPAGAVELADLPISRPLVLLFGNEAEGLRPETIAACDDTFRLDMAGFMESFNVSVCVGMALHHVLRRRRAVLAGEGRTGDLSDARRRSLLARWYVADVRGAAAVLRRETKAC